MSFNGKTGGEEVVHKCHTARSDIICGDLREIVQSALVDVRRSHS